MFPILNRKSEHHHWILHIRISLGTKFLLQLTILIFWTKFAQSRCFWSKTEKVYTTIEFYIFELVYVPNFRFNWQFWFFFFFDQNCPKRVFPVENGKFALLRVSMAVTYYIKLSRTGAYRHNSVLMPLLLLVTETMMHSTQGGSLI